MAMHPRHGEIWLADLGMEQSRIRGKNTTPERPVRSLLHKMGFRSRLHGTEAEITRNYRLTIEQVRACAAYAQERVREEKVFAASV
jgi:G:T-mismatch repair DNA endonuclease (very short patch repair protein)